MFRARRLPREKSLKEKTQIPLPEKKDGRKGSQYEREKVNSGGAAWLPMG